ncbi:hypothetical protein CFter6_0925 [Collimonas fungivorans]|uniref:Uncharacterized protein n=1 Tax=Collimonas fungivorans TaxID=158899 RepID=A0A127P7E3_9BURK|nr:hypothetical protein CFter6_0925 [Collimonas fungivorans]
MCRQAQAALLLQISFMDVQAVAFWPAVWTPRMICWTKSFSNQLKPPRTP